jgi:hypothetical protein
MSLKSTEKKLFEKEFPLEVRDRLQRDYCISGSEEEIKDFMMIVWEAARSQSNNK